jgi:hypothetical protein
MINQKNFDVIESLFIHATSVLFYLNEEPQKFRFFHLDQLLECAKKIVQTSRILPLLNTSAAAVNIYSDENILVYRGKSIKEQPYRYGFFYSNGIESEKPLMSPNSYKEYRQLLICTGFRFR